MDIISTTSRKRETYEIEIKYSPLWEAALGIAAITNTPLLDSMERPIVYWKETRDNLSKELQEHLDYAEKNNTWKSLLQLLHEKDFSTLEEFTSYIHDLSENKLKFICIPFTGNANQSLREQAANGNSEALLRLQEQTSENPFFPAYIEFICKAEARQLKSHLIEVMTDWFEQVIEPTIEKLEKILQTDTQSKARAKEKMSSEVFVEWATGGINYAPEPSIQKVLLIPHYIYRPWNVVADIEDTKVFYYPIANESVDPQDKDLPNNFLLLKHKALGDEVRMRIVKYLFERDRTLQDITEKLEMGKSTIHHHLKILRSAQLVEVNQSKYVLKKKAIESLANELDLYLHLR
ncbi:metalloregulator ArsR/SmtB family transcription factor [Virgibacillus sp. C22-A2]|uniref:Metalloregulator ArsR/SmtB family transcription factor n=1 Tax=Virgibacillus tibetensis TaxID=3042313 RepID=A0ABU6KFV2_9BACI|nr:metalloregulator ArsR/SmtB family transcription factor [Virgibacillus sp. C22-A2]